MQPLIGLLSATLLTLHWTTCLKYICFYKPAIRLTPLLDYSNQQYNLPFMSLLLIIASNSPLPPPYTHLPPAGHSPPLCSLLSFTFRSLPSLTVCCCLSVFSFPQPRSPAAACLTLPDRFSCHSPVAASHFSVVPQSLHTSHSLLTAAACGPLLSHLYLLLHTGPSVLSGPLHTCSLSTLLAYTSSSGLSFA